MVYFDNAATTPVPKAVADAMYEVLTAHFGNPSSQYPIGVEMKKAVEGWRAVIAGALGCPAERLYFTSCGTESDNWAIQAALWQNRHRGRHIITTAVEHSAVLEPCKLLAQQGYEVTYLKPGRDGNVTAEQVTSSWWLRSPGCQRVSSPVWSSCAAAITRPTVRTYAAP